MANEITLTKRAHQTESWTVVQIHELAKCAADPVYFLENYGWIQHPTKGRVKFVLFDYQKDLLKCYHDNKYSINMLGRQMGKTTVAAGYLLWYAMFVQDSTILIAAHKHTGAQEIMGRIRFLYENLPDHIRAGVTSYNKGSLDFENGSRIVSATTTETTGRGMSLTIVYLDEFAFVPPRIAQEFWTAISPTLSTGGKCIITSTPNQDDDQFARIWKMSLKTIDEFGNDTGIGVNGFRGLKFAWNHHPDREQSWADEERNKIGNERFLREHECEFITADETLISPVTLSELVSCEPVSKIGQIRIYAAIEPKKTYVLGWDPSLGTGGDFAAIQVFELPSMKQVMEWQHNRTDISGQMRNMVEMLNYIKQETKDTAEIYWSVENNTIGEAALMAIREYGEERIPGMMVTEPGNKRRGFTTGNKNKMSACMKLKFYIENKKMIMMSHNLIRETKNFVARGAGFAAKDGETDDLVMATILVVRIVQHMLSWDQKLYNQLTDRTETSSDLIMPMPIAI
jgi:hypothetical protein